MGVSPSRTVFAAAAYAPVLLPQHPNSAVCPRKTDYGLFGSNLELSDHKSSELECHGAPQPLMACLDALCLLAWPVWLASHCLTYHLYASLRKPDSGSMRGGISIGFLGLESGTAVGGGSQTSRSVRAGVSIGFLSLEPENEAEDPANTSASSESSSSDSSPQDNSEALLATSLRLDLMRALEVIGEGGQATVYAAVLQGICQPIAVRLAKNSMARIAIEAEKHVAQPFRHPNMLRTYAGVKDESGDLVGIACELHTGGSLWETIITQQLSLRHMSLIARDIARGLVYLHETCGFLHLDMSPANVVLTSQLKVGDMDAPRAVIIDFGLGAKMWHGSGYAVLDEGRGTVAYMAGEMLNRYPRVTPATDVCSLGLLMYSMAEGTAPFRDVPDEVQLHWLRSNCRHVLLPRPRDCHNLWWFLIQSCIHPDPLGRITLRDLICILDSIIRLSA